MLRRKRPRQVGARQVVLKIVGVDRAPFGYQEATLWQEAPRLSATRLPDRRVARRPLAPVAAAPGGTSRLRGWSGSATGPAVVSRF